MNACNRRVLIIDDNAAIHQDFRKIFAASAGGGAKLAGIESMLFGPSSETVANKPAFQIDSAYQGEEGLSMVAGAVAEERPYSMAFVDVRMPPGLDGIQTTKKLWAAYPDLHVVICTAYSDYSLDEMIKTLGHSDRFVILKKPFDNIEVLQLAIAMTEKWQLLQNARHQMDELEKNVQDRTRELEATNQKLRLEIDERQRVVQNLSATQEKLGRLLASSPVVTYSYKVIGQTLQPSWVSENINDMLGYSVEEWSRPDWEKSHLCIPGQESDTADFKSLLELGNSNCEQKLRCKDGKIRWVRNERKLLRDESGQPVQVVGAYTDITERRQLEEQLRQAQKMEAIGQLAGGVAHDFNNLLTVIGGYTQMLLADDGVAPKTMDALTRIAWASDRASDLTRRLLTYGRKQVMQPTRLDLVELILDVGKMLHRLLGEHITLKTECDSSGLTLFADRTMMEQIIMNLAVNARDAMPGGGTLIIQTGTVEVSAEQARGKIGVQPGRFVRLTIRDTGRGIPPEILPRIFEPFFTTKDVGQGTGLGLATVDGIVKSHRGWIEVESKVSDDECQASAEKLPGTSQLAPCTSSGTTFRIFLPASSDTPTATVSRPLEIKSERRSETILLVEDEPALRRLGRSILEKRGHRVLEAASGIEALGIWKNNADVIDLLFTDMVMPEGMTGGKLAAKLQTEKPELKVLFTSGYSTELLEDDCVLRDGMNFLPKPFNPQSLLTAVRHCLDGQQQPRPNSFHEDASASRSFTGKNLSEARSLTV